MPEPRKVTRWDPVEYCDQGSKGRGMMERDTDGDYVEYEDFRDLEAETQELAEALERINRYLHSDRINLWHLEANAAADLMQMRRFTDTALARHRAKQEVQS